MYEVLGRQSVRLWLAIVGSATLIIGAAYTMVQQSTRESANDVPLAIAQTVKSELESGAAPSDLVSTRKIDLKNNINPFVIITDDSGHVVASSALLNGQTPLPPKGVFSYTAVHNQDEFSWQPAAKVRLATEVLTYGKAPNSGFIVTGQSLKQSEDRVEIYTKLAVAAWLATVAWVTLMLLILERFRPRSKK